MSQKPIISDSYAAKQRNSSSKLLNREKNGGHLHFNDIDTLTLSGQMCLMTMFTLT